MLANDGLLYGVASRGGEHDLGTIWQLSLSVGFTKLHDFDVAGGSQPPQAPVQSPDGRFYGVTSVGGANDVGTLYRLTMPGSARLFCPNDLRPPRPDGGLSPEDHRTARRTSRPRAWAISTTWPARPSLPTGSRPLADEGITAGCGNGDGFCPLAAVTPRADGGLPPEDRARFGVHAAGLSGRLPGRPLSIPVRRLDRGPGRRGNHRRLRRRGFCPDRRSHSRADGRLPPEDRARTDLRAAGLPGRSSRDVACPSLFADWIEQLYEEEHHRGLRRHRDLTRRPP